MLHTLHQLGADQVPPQPWRNGGGSTRPLFAWPPASPGGAAAPASAATDDWVLRLSLADIAADGPFSAFPGVTRWFTVVDGPGVALQAPGLAATLTPESASLVFDGALAPMARLLGGPTRDLNLMLRGVPGGLWRARPGEAWHAPHPWRGLFCASPVRLRVPGQPPRELPAMTLVHAWLPSQADVPVPRSGPVPCPPDPNAEAWRIEPSAEHDHGHGQPAPRAWWLSADLTPDAP